MLHAGGDHVLVDPDLLIDLFVLPALITVRNLDLYLATEYQVEIISNVTKLKDELVFLNGFKLHAAHDI